MSLGINVLESNVLGSNDWGSNVMCSSVTKGKMSWDQMSLYWDQTSREQMSLGIRCRTSNVTGTNALHISLREIKRSGKAEEGE